ncbi:DDE-type integrase/transposase/recombinase [Micromonospora sp. LHW51205]|uniref:DDE-type integrase/transposase/recombinase n=1 Tax=Micromonospora sp. LHW51205 TaxID=2248752 RepID=UPI00351AADE6
MPPSAWPGLVVAALNMAAVTRGGDVTGVIFHSDRDSECCSADFARVCARWKVRQSMGRVGSCFDNAVGDAGELAVAEGVPGVWRVDPAALGQPFTARTGVVVAV